MTPLLQTADKDTEHEKEYNTVTLKLNIQGGHP